MDENRMIQANNSKKPNILLSGSILSSAVFVGSAFLFQSNEILGISGMIVSMGIMAIFALFRNK